MKPLNFSRFLIALSLSLTLVLGGCAQPPGETGAEPIPAVPAEVSAPEAPAEVEAIAQEESVKGGSLNTFFPGSEGDFERVFVQEKTGFSQAKLKENGEELGLLSINDLANNPKAIEKFKRSDKELMGYPLVTVGKTQTALLVGDRYQVKVKSNSEAFTPEDREVWLQKFNLTGLESLEN
ncbi:MAG: hypothetical protein ACFCA4_14670 [Cyanophyceae cyanobacterium]